MLIKLLFKLPFVTDGLVNNPFKSLCSDDDTRDDIFDDTEDIDAFGEYDCSLFTDDVCLCGFLAHGSSPFIIVLLIISLVGLVELLSMLLELLVLDEFSILFGLSSICISFNLIN